MREEITGCNGPAESITVTVNPNPAITVTTVDPSCGTADGEIEINVTTTTTAPYDYNAARTSPPIPVVVLNNLNDPASTHTFTGVDEGTYSVTLTDDNGCTAVENGVVLTEEPAPGQPSISFATYTVCEGLIDATDVLSIITPPTTTGGTFEWYDVDPATNPGATPIATGVDLDLSTLPALVFANSPYTYYAVEDNGNCQSAAAEVLVFVSPEVPGPPSVDQQTHTICPGSEVTFNITNTPVLGDHVWYDVDPVANPSATPVASFTTTYTTPVFNTAGVTETFWVRIETSCPGPALELTVDVVAAPAAPTATDVTFCAGDPNTQLTATTTGSGTLTWYDVAPTTAGATSIGTGSPFTPSPLPGAGTTTYFVREELPSGCFSSTTVVDLTLNALPTVSVVNTIDPSDCGVLDGEIEVSAAGGSGSGYEYSLDGGALQASGTFSGITDGSYTITATDDNGCVSDPGATPELTCCPTFTIAESITNPTCAGGPSDGSIEITSVTGGQAPYAYSIDGGTTYQTASTFSGLSPGAYTIDVEDANGCTGSINLSLDDPTVPPPAAPIADPANPTEACLGESFSLGASAGVAGANIWYDADPAGGAATQVGTGNAFTPGSLPGTGTTTYFVRTENGICISDATPVAIDILDAPTATISTDGVTCFGDADGQIDIAATGGTPNYAYSTDGGTSFPFADIDLPLTGLVNGSYDVVVRDNNGCTYTETVTVDEPAELSFSLDVTAPTCANTANGSITVVSPAGGTAPYQYSLNGGPTQAATGFGGLAGDTAPYSVEMTDANGCSATQTVTLTVAESIALNAINTVDASCTDAPDGALTIALDNPSDVPVTYTLMTPAGEMLAQSEAQFDGLLPGEYTVIAQNDLCPDEQLTATATIAAGASPTAASFTTDPAAGRILYLPDASLTLTNTSGNANTYLWEFGDGDTSSLENPVHMYQQEGVYEVTLTATLDGNCATTTTQTVSVEALKIFMPNAFSPNGDNTNDVFTLEVNDGLTGSMQVFDRWGRQVASEDALVWDGTYDGGDAAPEGVYMYTAEIIVPTTGEMLERTGTITLIR